MSLHSPNQYVGTGKALTPQGGYCPTTLAPPGEAWCFGVSGAGSFPDDPTERYINYAMKWDPECARRAARRTIPRPASRRRPIVPSSPSALSAPLSAPLSALLSVSHRRRRARSRSTPVQRRRLLHG